MTAIETTGLTKRYDTVPAVTDVDLSIDRAEVYGFLGPNGAGKSTTIALLLDYVRPTDGTARVLGLDAREDAVDISRRVGVLPESCELYERLSGRNHLEFAIRAMGSRDDPDSLLARVGLDEAGDRPVRAYSTGMTQRLKLALALVGDPDLLILDEPSSGLDPNGIRRLREIIAAECERGTTVFFSSHVLEQVEAVCDRVGIMVDGRLVVDGEIDSLRDDLGAAMRLSIETDEVPPSLGPELESVPSVTDVRVRDGSVDGTSKGGTGVAVTIDDHAAKVAVLRCVEAHTTVRDFSTEEDSLETVFERYAREET
ncbi:ABC transporter ATP-binding protein [Natrononativus amylolyticus]|uniref:ABC transporter ATP-binding protein n=1 Tax=Natrononativus amylolyticus TaxID=2963434 RepID=UPI0020CEEC70|nr:ABC transporter ATP-binding protein [Natrononativus amylolyticus]